MQCPNCQRENASTARFCGGCGQPFAMQRCPACGQANAPDDHFCIGCGERLPSLVAASRRDIVTTRPDNEMVAAGDAERRQLTVMFCDLVDSMLLSTRLDPEVLREVVRAYQAACDGVIGRFHGHIAQYLGDGLLVYFGYPRAHDDDASRAVRAALAVLEAIEALNARLQREKGVTLAVRVGIHTGLVVVGEVGGVSRHEALALGEAPNVAARLQGLAAPNTIVLSDATYRLVQATFACTDLGSHGLKGLSAPLRVYRALGESLTQKFSEFSTRPVLTPLVGREQEVGLLLSRWEQVKDGFGQVVLLSGEPGIGKSRLVHVLRERIAPEPHTRWECRCSDSYADSALFPMIDLYERELQFSREDAPAEKLRKIETALTRYGLASPETITLWASLLSVSLPEDHPPLGLTPQRQRQKTFETIVALLLALAAERPALFIMEDLHWVDPSTRELLDLILEQVPAVPILVLLTFRPEFLPPWGNRAHLTHLTVNRFTRKQTESMVERVIGRKGLPGEVFQQIIAKTDGVPLFVEELTKMVLESGLLRQREDRYELEGTVPPLAIPSTLQDSLTARLDRLATVKDVAQLGAALGRSFSYELLQAVAASVDEVTLKQALAKLVEAELLYQRGVPPNATYIFKHAMIQETAYGSMLKSRRQPLHQRIAQTLAERFPEITQTQPELLAHHYTEAGLSQLAVQYWQRAGQRALERSANLEAIAHLTQGLEVLKARPDTRERTREELDLQITLALALHATKGQAAMEVERAYARARELCAQVEDEQQLFRVLLGLYRFHGGRMQRQTAQELTGQLYSLAQRTQDPDLLLQAHMARGTIFLLLGEFTAARGHLEQAIAFYDPQHHRSHAVRYSIDPGVNSLSRASWVLWLLGYPDQALIRSQETLKLAQELAHPHSRAMALCFAAVLHQFRREPPAARELAEATVLLATEQGLAQWAAAGMFIKGWALTAEGQGEEGLARLCQGLTTYRATGTVLDLPWYLGALGEAYGSTGQAEAGLAALAEALAAVDNTDFYEAELYRLKGELLLGETVPNASQAQACFQQALAIARRQHAKSWELRTAMSLSRLWQRQNQRAKAHDVLSEVYGWFTEGFETHDLKEARALLDELS